MRLIIKGDMGINLLSANFNYSIPIAVIYSTSRLLSINLFNHDHTAMFVVLENNVPHPLAAEGPLQIDIIQ